jgi:hypothetical protein
VDTIDLYSARQRSHYVAMAAVELGLEERIVKRVEQAHDETLTATTRTAKADRPRLTADEEKAALDLRRDPRLLHRILTDLERCGVVGEADDKLFDGGDPRLRGLGGTQLWVHLRRLVDAEHEIVHPSRHRDLHAGLDPAAQVGAFADAPRREARTSGNGRDEAGARRRPRPSPNYTPRPRARSCTYSSPMGSSPMSATTIDDGEGAALHAELNASSTEAAAGEPLTFPENAILDELRSD